MMPTLPEEVGGGPSSVLTDGLRWAAVGVDLPPKLALRVTIQSKDNAAAEALEKELAVLWQKLGENEEVRRSVPNLQRTRQGADPPGRKAIGSSSSLDEANQGAAALVDALRPPVEAARRSASARRPSTTSSRSAWRCTTTTTSTSRSLRRPSATPRASRCLSWRVLLLPYLEEKTLYEQFHLDEPWDSPNNKKLIERMPTALPFTRFEANGAGPDELRRGRRPGNCLRTRRKE